MQTVNTGSDKGRFSALIPFFIFLLFYLGLSLWAKDFYKVPMPLAFIIASAAAMFPVAGKKISDKVEIFARGMGESNIMIMCLVFILAGILATIAKGMGAVDSAVIIARNLIPDRMLVCGIFLVACFISLAIGTSCGTIATLTPIAIGIGKSTGLPMELLIGSVVGGSMFGDNMSMISDTTIAATRTQNVMMRDKFLMNMKIAIPAAAATLLIYLFSGFDSTLSSLPVQTVSRQDVFLILPYILVLICALCGMNVMAVLFCGSLLAGTIGVISGKFDFWQVLKLSGDGSLGMAETLTVALLAGGLLNLIRDGGGIKYLLDKVEKCISGPKMCEAGIALLVTAVNLFTANNTVAIVISGPIACELSKKYSCDPRRSASILDTASCVVQGLLPYGAQILIAAGIAQTAGLQLAPLKLAGSIYYQMLMALALILFIICGNRGKR